MTSTEKTREIIKCFSHTHCKKVAKTSWEEKPSALGEVETWLCHCFLINLKHTHRRWIRVVLSVGLLRVRHKSKKAAVSVNCISERWCIWGHVDKKLPEADVWRELSAAWRRICWWHWGFTGKLFRIISLLLWVHVRPVSVTDTDRVSFTCRGRSHC